MRLPNFVRTLVHVEKTELYPFDYHLNIVAFAFFELFGTWSRTSRYQQRKVNRLSTWRRRIGENS